MEPGLRGWAGALPRTALARPQGLTGGHAWAGAQADCTSAPFGDSSLSNKYRKEPSSPAPPCPAPAPCPDSQWPDG